MLSEFQKLAILSLFHDIGKLKQRAITNIGKKHEFWSKISLSLFENKELEMLAQILYEEKAQDKDSRETVNFKGGENERLDLIMKIADKLAALERENRENKNNVDVKNEPLRSVFNIINNVKKGVEDKNDKETYLKPTTLNINEDIFPIENKENIHEMFDKLFNEFQEGIDYINKLFDLRNKEIEDFDKFFTYLYYLIKRYMTFVPSAAYVHKPTISLFDHSRITSAIATALYLQLEKEDKLKNNYLQRLNEYVNVLYRNENKENNDKENEGGVFFTLIHGDISGIQKFIFTIKSKGALKTLRGRSNYLSFLNEAIAYYIVKELGLTIANIIYVGGGHFYILAPLYAGDKLEKIRKKINKLIYENIGLNLYLSLSGVKMSIHDFSKTQIGNKWQEATIETSKYKSQKFKELFSKDFFFKNNNIKKLVSCSVCNKELDVSKDKIYKEKEDGNELEEVEHYEQGMEVYCQLCKEFFELGKKINTLAKGIYDNTNMSEESKKYEIKINNLPIIRDLGIPDYLMNKKHLLKLKNNIIEPFSIIPLDKKGLKDFESLVTELDKKGNKVLKKDPYIASLKMDVDSLGLIFKEGIKNNSMSLMATLSNQLTLFFKGYINKIVNKYDRVRIVFSGGDDIFIVGYWEEVLQTAQDIINEFKKYVSNNPHITISAGYIITNRKFPIAEAAELAEEMLDESKSCEGKNRITIFNVPLRLDKENELELTMRYYNDLIKAISNEKARSILNRIIYMVKRANKKLNNKKISIPEVWRLKYHLIRIYEKRENFEVGFKISDKIDEIVKAKLSGKDSINIMIFAVAARLAEIKTKERGGKNDGSEI